MVGAHCPDWRSRCSRLVLVCVGIPLYRRVTVDGTDPSGRVNRGDWFCLAVSATVGKAGSPPAWPSVPLRLDRTVAGRGITRGEDRDGANSHGSGPQLTGRDSDDSPGQRLRVHRDPDADLRPVRLFVDSAPVGELEPGADTSLPVAAGEHDVQSRIGRSRSPTVRIRLRPDETVTLRTRTSGPKWARLLTAWGRWGYVLLERVAEGKPNGNPRAKKSPEP
jgi:hypothetical protein